MIDCGGTCALGGIFPAWYLFLHLLAWDLCKVEHLAHQKKVKQTAQGPP